ncbi:hypothetical protein K6U06_17745 [Acidiferrimicrobium sp. IK]|uniref:hypothetical protein n=1 Tax=Acidiferrimicrobium sp. IK TaxID=2871700 RepID=UPI0021CB343D|nr:hypothetical protein [Acidiferrimicrobium sp. IK]MCU4186214.1 hypothetical protein [Acidiferrimicrobium sp. IK]
MTLYASLAQNPEEEQHGITLREAFTRALVLLWQDNDDDQLESIWRTLAARPGPFADEVIEVLGAVVAEPPDDLVELIRTHGWVPLIHEEAGAAERVYTQAEAVAWLIRARDRLAAIRTAERPAAGTSKRVAPSVE